MIKWMKEVYEYRDMIAGLIKRDLRGRYKGSFLGFFWNFMSPVFQIIVYIIVFSNVFDSGLEYYYVYLISGMFPWLFFSESLSEGSGAVLHQAEMTKKIYFPREVLPISVVSSRFINMLITFIILFLVVGISGIGFNFIALCYLPIVIVIEYIVVLDFVLFLSAIDVYFRDVEFMTGVFLMAWIWITPIMYSIEQMSGWLLRIVRCNPMTTLVMAYHDILYYKKIPDLYSLAIMAIVGIIFFVICEFIFKKLERNFAEEM